MNKDIEKCRRSYLYRKLSTIPVICLVLLIQALCGACDSTTIGESMRKSVAESIVTCHSETSPGIGVLCIDD